MTFTPTAVALGPQDAERLLELDTWAAPSQWTPSQWLEHITFPAPWERTVALADGQELVAMHASYPFAALPVPGGRVRAAGLTWVGVHPGYRRRGLLRSMMARHLEDCRERGEAVSVLFAAEPAIYGRFGWGSAARHVELSVPRGAELREVSGSEDVQVRLEVLDAERHGPVLQALHAAVDRPGWATRPTPETLAMTLFEFPDRQGWEPARIAWALRDGEPVGYALFRRKDAWEHSTPKGEVEVREFVAPDAAVTRALWAVLTDLDLMVVTRTPMTAPDDPLLSLLVDARQASPRMTDNLWLRIVDLPEALASRRYAAPLDVVLEVTDTAIAANAGRWRLRTTQAPTAGTPGWAAVVEPVAADGEADLVADVRELGAAYLGGTSLRSLADADLVRARDAGVLWAASIAFGWDRAPLCGWLF